MKFFLFLAFFLIPFSVTANPFPAFYDVHNVAADDQLNVREEPSAKAPKIGALSFAQTHVEVVATSEDGKWGLVNLGERAGWVSLAYMKRWPGQDWGDFQMPESCFGTEPFWGLAGLHDEMLELADMSGKTFRYRLTASMGTIGHGARHWLVGEALVDEGTAGENTGRMLHATFRRERCNDGMSDREYGLAIDLFADTDEDGPLALSGCCSLADY